MRRLILLCVLFALLPSAPTLTASLSTDRPDPGEDVIATIVVFDGSGDVAVNVDLPTGLELAQPIAVIHAAPVGLTVVRLHVRADALSGPRVLRFSAGGQAVERQIYVGTFPWPPPHPPHGRWLPLIRR